MLDLSVHFWCTESDETSSIESHGGHASVGNSTQHKGPFNFWY